MPTLWMDFTPHPLLLCLLQLQQDYGLISDSRVAVSGFTLPRFHLSEKERFHSDPTHPTTLTSKSTLMAKMMDASFYTAISQHLYISQTKHSHIEPPIHLAIC